MSKLDVMVDEDLVEIESMSAPEFIELLMSTTQRMVDAFAGGDDNRIGVSITIVAGDKERAANCVSGTLLATGSDPEVLMLLGGMKAACDALSAQASARMVEVGERPADLN